MIAQPAIHGQPVFRDPSTMSSQQTQRLYATDMAQPIIPAHSPSNSVIPDFHYRSSPPAFYIGPWAASLPSAMTYDPLGPTGYSTENSAGREQMGPIATQCEDMPQAPNQCLSQLFTFTAPQVGGVPSKTSSFASDRGTASRQRLQEAPKKRISGTGTRRPRKPPVEVVAEPKLQSLPDMVRNAPRPSSPKRARMRANQTKSEAAVERTPDSIRTVSPGATSKAEIGQGLRTSHADGPRAQRSERLQQSLSDSSTSLGKNLQELIEETQALSKRTDELEKEVQRFKNEISLRTRHAIALQKELVELKC